MSESDWKYHRRSHMAQLRPYVVGEDITGISISPEDRAAGSPKAGDWIARDPRNKTAMWLVAQKYYAENYTPTP